MFSSFKENSDECLNLFIECLFSCQECESIDRENAADYNYNGQDFTSNLMLSLITFFKNEYLCCAV